MKLQPAREKYDRQADQEFRNAVERMDGENFKKRQHIDLGGNAFYVILTSPNGTRYSVTVSNAGALVVTAL